MSGYLSSIFVVRCLVVLLGSLSRFVGCEEILVIGDYEYDELRWKASGFRSVNEPREDFIHLSDVGFVRTARRSVNSQKIQERLTSLINAHGPYVNSSFTSSYEYGILYRTTSVLNTTFGAFVTKIEDQVVSIVTPVEPRLAGIPPLLLFTPVVDVSMFNFTLQQKVSKVIIRHILKSLPGLAENYLVVVSIGGLVKLGHAEYLLKWFKKREGIVFIPEQDQQDVCQTGFILSGMKRFPHVEASLIRLMLEHDAEKQMAQLFCPGKPIFLAIRYNSELASPQPSTMRDYYLRVEKMKARSKGKWNKYGSISYRPSLDALPEVDEETEFY